MYTKILVPTDGSKLSDRAVKHAGKLASLAGARVQLLYVHEPYDESLAAELSPAVYTGRRKMEATLRARAKALLDKAARLVTDRGAVAGTTFVISPSPYEEILKTAKKEKCDLVVMASHGRRGLAGVILGSVAQKVLTHSRCPVLIVK